MSAEADTTIRMTKGNILAKLSITEDIKKIRIQHDEIAARALPGQFINIRTSNSFMPLLRRPFSINQTNPEKGWFDILFRVIGAGTKALLELPEGSEIDFIGPLGNSFSFPEENRTVLLLAGGLGIAPLEFFAQKLSEKNFSVHLFWGNQSKEPFVYQEYFSQLNLQTHFATDDGSLGFQGTIVDLLDRELANFSVDEIQIYGCGPDAMLRALQKMAIEKKINCQISLETMMACGFGACMGCNVAKYDSDGYFYVCKDGPVFDIKDVRIYG